MVKGKVLLRMILLKVREPSLMTSLIRVGRGSKIVPNKGRDRVGQGR